MYDPDYLSLTGICTYLGVGRSFGLRLCNEKPHGFPVVKIGNRWQADAEKLKAWRDRWYSGEFEI